MIDPLCARKVNGLRLSKIHNVSNAMDVVEGIKGNKDWKIRSIISNIQAATSPFSSAKFSFSLNIYEAPLTSWLNYFYPSTGTSF